MRKWGWGHAPSVEPAAEDVETKAHERAWDGLRGRPDGVVVIQAPRAADAAEHRQVA